MKKFNPGAFESARRFLLNKARELDLELFKYHFENGAVGAVQEALAAYQNEDGGFGRGLEPDVRTPSSSALATGIGLSILKELGLPAGDEMVRRACNYLRGSYDERAQVWRVVPLDTNQHPHAPWWHDEDGSLAQTFDRFLIIPRAQLVGLLHHFGEMVPADWLESVTSGVIRDVLSIEPLGSGGGDDLVYAINLAETQALPQDQRTRLVTRVRQEATRAVTRDPEKWSTYSIPPLKLAPRPDSLVADLMEDDLQRHLDYLIDHQTEQGYWEPTWSWGDAYPQVWERACMEWRGHLTLENLKSLKAFNRIE